jgi:hypothetical protein
MFNGQIIELLRKHQSPNIKNIVIFGTNHQDVGPLIISVADPSFQSLISTEHSYQNTFQVAKVVYPRVSVTGYLFRPGHDYPAVFKFADSLKTAFDPSTTLFLASVDFAHYLDELTSLQNDATTLDLLTSHNYPSLSNLTSTHTDCPDCLIAMARLFGTDHLLIPSHTYQSATSYFFMTW